MKVNQEINSSIIQMSSKFLHGNFVVYEFDLQKKYSKRVILIVDRLLRACEKLKKKYLKIFQMVIMKKMHP